MGVEGEDTTMEAGPSEREGREVGSHLCSTGQPSLQLHVHTRGKEGRGRQV